MCFRPSRGCSRANIRNIRNVCFGWAGEKQAGIARRVEWRTDHWHQTRYWRESRHDASWTGIEVSLNQILQHSLLSFCFSEDLLHLKVLPLPLFQLFRVFWFEPGVMVSPSARIPSGYWIFPKILSCDCRCVPPHHEVHNIPANQGWPQGALLAFGSPKGHVNFTLKKV